MCQAFVKHVWFIGKAYYSTHGSHMLDIRFHTRFTQSNRGKKQKGCCAAGLLPHYSLQVLHFREKCCTYRNKCYTLSCRCHTFCKSVALRGTKCYTLKCRCHTFCKCVALREAKSYTLKCRCHTFCKSVAL